MSKIPVRQIRTEIESGITGKFKIRELSSLLKGKDMVHEHHRHDFFFLLLLERGKGFHEVDFVNMPVQDRSVFLLRPGQVHRLELQAASHGFLVEFDHAFYAPQASSRRQRLLRAGQKQSCRFAPARFRRMHSILKDIFHEYQEKSWGYDDAIRACLDLFFLEFIRQSQQPVRTAVAPASYTQQRMDEFMELLETQIHQKKQVSEYAAMLYLSPYQLNAITRDVAGKTASALIHEQVILEARRCLLATTHPVKDIAYSLGYDDAAYFIRFFRKHTGHTPEAFRRISS